MKAVFTLTFWLELDEEAQAIALASEVDRRFVLSLLDRFEAADHDLAGAVGNIGVVGTNYWILDEKAIWH